MRRGWTRTTGRSRRRRCRRHPMAPRSAATRSRLCTGREQRLRADRGDERLGAPGREGGGAPPAMLNGAAAARSREGRRGRPGRRDDGGDGERDPEQPRCGLHAALHTGSLGARLLTLTARFGTLSIRAAQRRTVSWRTQRQHRACDTGGVPGSTLSCTDDHPSASKRRERPYARSSAAWSAPSSDSITISAGGQVCPSMLPDGAADERLAR